MSETPKADRILDAASIVLVDWQGSAPRILMGKRRPDNIFLPNKWVFPGGRLENSDALIACEGALDPADEAVLLTRVPGVPPDQFAKALALAAIRELFEETGYAIANLTGDDGTALWPGFQNRRLKPRLSPLRLFARAITPPGRPRRYDTRFFIADLTEALHHPDAADQEFTELAWLTLAEARTYDLPTITRVLMSDLDLILTKTAAEARMIPFYYEENGVSRRDLLTREP